MAHDDPRLADDHVRRPAGTDGIVLVGVVHDHPASVFRAREVVREVDPAALALELPPLAVPLFAEYASTGQSPPPRGGEMSAAIQAGNADYVVGIDGPSGRFLRRLVGRILRERHSPGTVRPVASNVVSISKRAIGCRLGAVVSRVTGHTVAMDNPSEHDCEWSDEPAVQARSERSRIRQARAVMNTFQSAGASELQETTREGHMAARIRSLSKRADAVVAVVGIAHLDAVAGRLATN